MRCFIRRLDEERTGLSRCVSQNHIQEALAIACRKRVTNKLAIFFRRATTIPNHQCKLDLFFNNKIYFNFHSSHSSPSGAHGSSPSTCLSPRVIGTRPFLPPSSTSFLTSHAKPATESRPTSRFIESFCPIREACLFATSRKYVFRPNPQQTPCPTNGILSFP